MAPSVLKQMTWSLAGTCHCCTTRADEWRPCLLTVRRLCTTLQCVQGLQTVAVRTRGVAATAAERARATSNALGTPIHSDVCSSREQKGWWNGGAGRNHVFASRRRSVVTANFTTESRRRVPSPEHGKHRHDGGQQHDRGYIHAQFSV